MIIFGFCIIIAIIIEKMMWNAFSLIKWTNNKNNSYQFKKKSVQQAQEKESGRERKTTWVMRQAPIASEE